MKNNDDDYCGECGLEDFTSPSWEYFLKSLWNLQCSKMRGGFLGIFNKLPLQIIGILFKFMEFP